jgi:hypothetical protein
MGKAIPSQHPPVAFRSNLKQLRVLLAVAAIAVAGLIAAVVILGTDEGQDAGVGSATQVSTPGPAGSTRYDGGPEEGTRGVVPARQPGVRYDGGPEEGTAALTARSAPATVDPNSLNEAPGVRYDGGPEEGTRGPLASSSLSTRYDGGPEEGSRGAGH